MMLKTTRSLIAMALCSVLYSCAQVDYSEYFGQQRKWPTSRGAYVNRKYKLPVYIGVPDRPYIVLGYINVETEPKGVFQQDDSIEDAVKEAAKHGAQAVVLLSNRMDTIGSSTFSTANWGSNTTGDLSGALYGNNFYGNYSSNTTGSGWGTRTTLPMRRGYATAIAIKLL